MLQEATKELRKFEKKVFEVEATCSSIYTDLKGEKPFIEKDLKSPLRVLESALKLLQQAKAEIKVFVGSFTELGQAMLLENPDKTLSGKCNQMTDSFKGFEQRFIEINPVRIQIGKIYLVLMKKEYVPTGKDGRESRESNFKKNRNKAVTPKSVDHRAEVGEMLSAIQAEVSTVVRTSQEVKNQCQSLQDAREKLELQGEKQSLLTRLSKVAGAKLTDNNPNIADLSDRNGPTKIAEEYSELYDNAWTDAYDFLEKSGDQVEDSLQLLYDILIKVYGECGRYARKQDCTIRTMLVCPTAELDFTENTKSKGAKSENDQKSTVDVPAVQSKTISELRKQTTAECTEDVTKYLKKTCKEWFRKNPLEAYTARCIKLCWLMQVQTPPLHIETDVQPGSKFDKDKYKEYTRSGKKVDFVVWPALALTKGGGLLMKGVAQGKK